MKALAAVIVVLALATGAVLTGVTHAGATMRPALATTTTTVAPTTTTVAPPEVVVQPQKAATASTTTTTLPNPWPSPKPADTPSLAAQGPSCPPSGDIIAHRSTETPGVSKTYEWIDIHCGVGQSGWYWVAPVITTDTLAPVVYTNQTCYAPPKMTLPGQPTQTGVDTSKEVCW